jgi:hypothetical protein
MRIDGNVDLSTFKELADDPFPVPEVSFTVCTIPPDLIEGTERRGPHFRPAIRLFANGVAADAIARRNSGFVMPVGSIIVKLKLRNADAKIPEAVAAMVKREPGFSTASGDWEYVYASSRSSVGLHRGALANCARCHRKAAATDHLFLNYLGPQDSPTNETGYEY